jgi:hypothetical protein
MVVCLLILAFCESVRCHGDDHLDNSSEQGFGKWQNRIGSKEVSTSLLRASQVEHSVAARVILTAGCHSLPEPVIVHSLLCISPSVSLSLFIASYLPIICDINSDVSDFSVCQDLPVESGLPTFVRMFPTVAPSSCLCSSIAFFRMWKM